MSVTSPALRQHTYLDARATLIMLMLCLVWGLNIVAVKIAGSGISPIWMASIRSIGGALIVVLWMKLRGVPIFERDRSLGPGIITGLFFTSTFLLFFEGIALTTAARCTLFFYTSPFVVAIAAHFLLPGERLTAKKVAGLILAFCGLVLAVYDGLTLPTLREITGDMLVFGAAAIWAFQNIYFKASRLRTLRPEKTLLYQLSVSSALMPLALLVFPEAGIINPTEIVWLSLIFQAVIVVAASYLCWFWLMLSYPVSRLSSFSFLVPVIGFFASALILGEQLSHLLWITLLLIGAGLWLVNKR